MAKKKSPRKFPLLTEKSPQEQVLYIGGLLENIETQVKMVAENQLQMEERLTARAEAIRDELKQDIHFTQLAVKSNKDEILVLQEDVSGLKEDVSGLKEDVSGLKEDVGGLKEDVGGLKSDIKRLEGKVDQVIEKVDRHDEEIAQLKSAAI